MDDKERLEQKEKILEMLRDMNNKKSIIRRCLETQEKIYYEKNRETYEYPYAETIFIHRKEFDELYYKVIIKLKRIVKQFIPSGEDAILTAAHVNFSEAIDELKCRHLDTYLDSIIHIVNTYFPGGKD